MDVQGSPSFKYPSRVDSGETPLGYFSSATADVNEGSSQKDLLAFSQLQSAMNKLQRTKSAAAHDPYTTNDLVSRLAALNSMEQNPRRSTLHRTTSQGSLLCTTCGAEYPNIQALQGHQVLAHKPGMLADPSGLGGTKRQRTALEDASLLQRARQAACQELVRSQEANSKSRHADHVADVTRKLLGPRRAAVRHARSASQPMIESPRSPLSPQPSCFINFDANGSSPSIIAPAGRNREPPQLTREHLTEIKMRSAVQDSSILSASNSSTNELGTPSFRHLARSGGSQDVSSILNLPGGMHMDMEHHRPPHRLASVPSDLLLQMQRLSAQSSDSRPSSAPLSRLASQTSMELTPYQLSESVSRSSSLSKGSPPAALAAAAEAWLAAQTGVSVAPKQGAEELDLTLRL